MNILPKKRWHVRTKDNIARVRRDEATAKEEEQKRQEKLILAESEARINFLRKKSGVPICSINTEESSTNNDLSTPSGNNIVNQHVDLFSDYKSHIKKTNKALEDEKKEEQEKYEKQIGYLTYLGQDTNEALKLRSWYEVAPKRSEVGDSNTIEKDVKNKQSQDPLTLINALLPKVEQKKVVCVESDLKQRSREDISTPDTSSPSKKIRKYESITEKFKNSKQKKSKKHKKHKHKKGKVKKKKRSKYEDNESDTEEIQRIKHEKLEKLRKERLIREASERARQEALLAPIKPVQEFDNTNNMPHQRIVQKYNSQFNPEIAKQNMI
ncbi:leukocyte receptor cluster member 1 homolog [Bactrocera oleae]|uniref:leukocyte receptor cluster member 1 homolog n=1 Tax=Bactrocera oleae TaxID=104688 RepID=UPI00387EB7FA